MNGSRLRDRSEPVRVSKREYRILVIFLFSMIPPVGPAREDLSDGPREARQQFAVASVLRGVGALRSSERALHTSRWSPCQPALPAAGRYHVEG